jgi:hypothetical protein
MIIIFRKKFGFDKETKSKRYFSHLPGGLISNNHAGLNGEKEE